MLTKVCTKCKVEKPTESFPKDKRRKDGLFSWCKSCKSVSDGAVYSKNRNRILDRHKRYYLENKQQLLEYQSDYYNTNKSHIRSIQKAYFKKYVKENADLINARTALRHASKLRATPPWASKEHVESFYIISSLLRDAGHDVHVDHIVPLQSNKVCGLHCEANLQLLSANDNLSKGNRHWPDMW